MSSFKTTIIETSVKHSSLVEKLTRFLCEELDVKPKRLSIVSYDLDDDTLGLCIDESDDEFTVLVKERNRNIGEICTTIAHEMIHVKQHMKENLGWFLDNRKDIPYMERWWEKEAFSTAVPLVEKFAKTL